MLVYQRVFMTYSCFNHGLGYRMIPPRLINVELPPAFGFEVGIPKKKPWVEGTAPVTDSHVLKSEFNRFWMILVHWYIPKNEVIYI
jgi:hypothetical protein